MATVLIEAILGSDDTNVSGSEFQLTPYDVLLRDYDEDGLDSDRSMVEYELNRQLYSAICRDVKQMGARLSTFRDGGVEVEGSTFSVTVVIEDEISTDLLNRLPLVDKTVMGADGDLLYVKGKVSFDKARWYLGLR